MLPQNEDKKMLIESMKKLTHHIANNSQRQRDIFNSLSKNDLNKILQNLNWKIFTDLRRVSGLLLCELLYNNSSVKQDFISTLEISPNNGRMCLSKIPESIQKYPSTMKRCLQLLKSPIKRQQLMKLCWAINLDRKVLQLQFFDYKKYSSFTFLDPSRNLFGFTMMDSQFRARQSSIVQKNTNRNTSHSSRQNSSNMNYQRNINDQKQKTSTSKQKISQNYLRNTVNYTTPSSLYQNYVQSAHPKNNSRSKQRQTLNPNQLSRFSTTSKEKLSIKYYRPVQTPTNGRFVYKQKPEFHQTIAHDEQIYSNKKQSNINSSNSKAGNTIHSISQFARNSNRKNTIKNQLNGSLNANIVNRSVTDSYQNQSTNADQKDKGSYGRNKNSLIENYQTKKGYGQLQRQKHLSPASRFEILASRKYGRQYAGTPSNKNMNASNQIGNQDLIPSVQLVRPKQEQKTSRRHTFGVSNSSSYQRKQKQRHQLKNSEFDPHQLTDRQKQSYLTLNNSSQINKGIALTDRQKQYGGYSNMKRSDILKNNDLFYKKVKEILRK